MGFVSRAAYLLHYILLVIAVGIHIMGGWGYCTTYLLPEEKTSKATLAVTYIIRIRNSCENVAPPDRVWWEYNLPLLPQRHTFLI